MGLLKRDKSVRIVIDALGLHKLERSKAGVASDDDQIPTITRLYFQTQLMKIDTYYRI